MLENVKVSSNINLKDGQMRYDMQVVWGVLFSPANSRHSKFLAPGQCSKYEVDQQITILV